MINLPVEVLEVLEKTASAEDDFTALFKGLSMGSSGRIVVPVGDMMLVHSALLLHVIANLVEAQAKIEQLEEEAGILQRAYYKGDE